MDIQTLWGQFLLNNAAVQNISPATVATVPNIIVNNVSLGLLIPNNQDEVSNDASEKDENEESSCSSEDNCEEQNEVEVKVSEDSVSDGSTSKECKIGGEKGEASNSGDVPTDNQKGKIARTRYSEEYHCDSCPYTCYTEKALLKHTLHCDNSEEGLKKLRLSCPVCGKDRQDDIALSVHMERHRQDKYFCCDMCKFKSIQLKKIILHRRMHTGEKPHLCPYCTYRSSRKDNLRNHSRRVHKNDMNDCDTFIPRKIVIRPKK